MIAGVRGSLLSHEAMERVIPAALRGQLGEAGLSRAHRQIRILHRRIEAAGLGPASSPRAVFDVVGAPVFAHLGYRALPLSSSGQSHTFALQAGGTTVAVMLVTAWGQDLSTTWREAVRQGIGSGTRWCFCLSGTRLRIADSERTYSRRHLEFDMSALEADESAFGIVWGLLRASAVAGNRAHPGLLDRAVAISDSHRVFVRDSLQRGVEQALACLSMAFRSAPRRRAPPSDRDHGVKEESLIVLYRLLFLLFAEARGLVPHWHPVFRDAYTLESLRTQVETLTAPTGLWETLQAMFRLAHHGCRAGALRVAPFNGRLFSPAHAPLADALPLADGPVREALLALTTRAGRTGRDRIAYGDLGVEQLGGVYERLLDFDGAQGSPRKLPGNRRKATGSFYTPRPLTEYLVRRALAPLVEGATPAQILALRVLDPSMGSGAFLVAACRYLGTAYEHALIREGSLTPPDIDDGDRAGFRRLVAQQCLFGVDANPMAVQLGRLSLWLATLAADRPLTFLDHRLRAGDSLVGSSPSDVLRQPPPGRAPAARLASLPLFQKDDELGGALGSAIAVRAAVAREPGDTLAQVRNKERALAGLELGDSALGRWKRVADIWCSGWFRESRSRGELRSAFHALTEAVMTGRSSLPRQTLNRMLAETEQVASSGRFFHWTLEFPEVFHDELGSALESPGFDAVIGNPPWEMLRADRGASASGGDRSASCLAGFARTAGVYRLQGDGHANLYQLFLERALSLVRRGGRLGLILPSGFAIDHGCALLRRALLDGTLVDTFQCFENRDGLFPIHRGLKFLLLSATAGGKTTALPARFGLRKAEVLDALPDRGADAHAVPLTRPFLERFSGEQTVIPEIRSTRDLQIVSSIAFTIPALGHSGGWHVTFGRELNATDDRRHFVRHGAGIPVIDGKHIRPFAADPSRARHRVPARVADRLAGGRLAYRRPRLAYRDVASSSNRLTLISAIVPAGVLTTHTVFCAREEMEEDVQLYLCGMLNSFVANYLVRVQVGTHLTVAMMARLPVPMAARESAGFRAVAGYSRRLASSLENRKAAAALQAAAARLYGLGREEFAHVLASFPLVRQAEREAALQAFTI